MKHSIDNAPMCIVLEKSHNSIWINRISNVIMHYKYKVFKNVRKGGLKQRFIFIPEPQPLCTK